MVSRASWAARALSSQVCSSAVSSPMSSRWPHSARSRSRATVLAVVAGPGRDAVAVADRAGRGRDDRQLLLAGEPVPPRVDLLGRGARAGHAWPGRRRPGPRRRRTAARPARGSAPARTPRASPPPRPSRRSPRCRGRSRSRAPGGRSRRTRPGSRRRPPPSRWSARVAQVADGRRRGGCARRRASSAAPPAPAIVSAWASTRRETERRASDIASAWRPMGRIASW